jgi:hypothetical protein
MNATSGHDAGLTLITGASSGIGEALARVFARRGHRLILTGRSHSRLTALAEEIAAKTGQTSLVIAADLGRKNAGRNLADQLSHRKLKPRYIVNSAGNGLFGRTDRLTIDEQIALIEVNCSALTEITLALLPGVIALRGGVLNVGSVGGFIPGPGMAVYFATKAYVQSFSQGLRSEYNDGRVHVTALCPGPVATRFQARAGMIAPVIPRLLDINIDTIAQAGYRGLMRNRAVVVPGFFNALMVWSGGLMFHRICAPFVRRYHFGRTRPVGSFGSVMNGVRVTAKRRGQPEAGER